MLGPFTFTHLTPVGCLAGLSLDRWEVQFLNHSEPNYVDLFIHHR